jgi:hypothetical protein
MVDFPEGDLQGVMKAFMHRQNGTSGSDRDGYTTTARLPNWHTAVIDPRWQHRRHLDEPGAEHSDALGASVRD